MGKYIVKKKDKYNYSNKLIKRVIFEDDIQMKDGGSFVAMLSFNKTDYRERFEEKREATRDIVADGDGLTHEMVHDLVLTANKAVWQDAKRD